MKIPVIYQDGDILVVNKPAGVNVYDLEAGLAKKYKGIKIVSPEEFMETLRKESL